MNNKKNIVITGASSGIGSAIALRMAHPNNRLILLARNQQKLDTISTLCEQKSAEVITYSIDVTEYQKLQELMTEIDTQHQIDLIICNAGVTNCVGKKGEPETWEEITQVIDTNLKGVLASLNPLISRMQKRKQGHIAIISSLGAFYGMPITPSYCASKSALKGYGESIRGWLRHDNIKVTMVYPGFVKSDLSDQFISDRPFMMTPEKAANIIVTGIEKNKPSITFPFPLNFGTWFLSVMPARISDWFMNLLFGAGKR